MTVEHPVGQRAQRASGTFTRGELLARLCGRGSVSDDEPTRFSEAFRRLGETAGRARAATPDEPDPEPAALERLLRQRRGTDVENREDGSR